MHIPDGELFDVAFELRQRLKKGGKLLISMPVERGDIRPGGQRDEAGRLMIIRSVAQVRLLFERLGFELENEWKSADSAGRGFLWATLYFQSSGVSTRAIDRVESIINADRKVATYKLALIRALCDIAMTSWASARWEPIGSVSVPLLEVSEKWRQHYWPLLEGAETIPQINAEAEGGKPIAFRQSLSSLVRYYHRSRARFAPTGASACGCWQRWRSFLRAKKFMPAEKEGRFRPCAATPGMERAANLALMEEVSADRAEGVPSPCERPTRS